MRGLWALLLLFLFVRISAQSEIRGRVVFPDGSTAKANLILLNANNETETFGFSDKTGSFSLRVGKKGAFRLQIKALNFITKEIAVDITKENQVLDLKTIDIEKVSEIKEVVITRANPIKIKKDTIEFNAQSFSSDTELTVEDLLRKIPGITVGSDGKIKFGKKEVERVMVENDDLFEQGYQTLTQNMPSASLDKIQVLKNYSKNKLLKGIEDSERVAINLTIKEKMKSQWFGSAHLVSSSYIENRHQAKFNLMNFSKKRKIYGLVNYNNLGVDEMKGVGYLLNPSSANEVENVGENLPPLSIVHLHSKNQFFEDKRTNFNNDKLASINTIYNFQQDWKLKIVTLFNAIENRNYIDSRRTVHYDGLQFTNIESKAWKQNKQNIIGKIELLKERPSSSLLFYNKLAQLDEINDNRFVFNQQINFQNGNNQLFTNENRLVYTRKKDENTAIVAVAKYVYQHRPYTFFTENDVFQYVLNHPDIHKIKQNIDSKKQFVGAKFSFLKTYSEHKKLELQAGNEIKKDFLNTDVNFYGMANESINADTSDFRNNLSFLQNNAYAQFKFSNKKGRWNYGLQLTSQLIYTDYNNASNAGFYWTPNLNIGYQNRKIGVFNFSISRKISTMEITDVYQNYIYQGDRSFIKNEMEITQLPQYTMNFSYNIGNELSNSLHVLAFYHKNEDYISNNMIVNPNYTIYQNILVKNNANFSVNVEAKKYLRFIKSKLSLSNAFFTSNYENSVNNGSLIHTRFSNFKTGVGLKSGWTKNLNYEMGYEWRFNTIDSPMNQNKYIDQTGFLNIYFRITSLLRLESYKEMYKLGNTPQNSIYFWDVKLNYQLKKHKANLFMMGINILNNNEMQRYSITNISESIYNQKLLPRYVALGINKSF
ncbi:hypothetical protein [Bergeyella sp. RCAD1439]|uniref:hypothetical protein n=1 Tax=Bergeyella anatis TaxID=3113737 RepID=UPI002E19D8BB|nr:hypothetical protein [Bergeyella sp. RCAD1439]